MGKSKTVSIEEIKKNNPRFCLSPLRVFGRCYECPQYLSKAGIPCDSRIENPYYENLIKRKKKIQADYNKELEEINKTIENLTQ